MDFTPEKVRRLSRWIISIATACILIFIGVQSIGAITNAISWITTLIMPLILGFAFALILNVPMCFFESHIWSNSQKPFLQKLRRPISYIISLILIIGILVGLISLVIPELVDAVKIIVQESIEFINKLNAMDEAEIAELPLGNLFLNTDWNKMFTTLQNWFKNQSGTIMNTAVGTISSFVGGLFNFIISFVFSIYILFSKETLKKQAGRLIRAWLPKNFGEWLIHAASLAIENFRNFVSGQVIEAIVLGVLCMTGMLILKIPYAPMVGALVGVTALIPVLGAFIGIIVGAFIILTVDTVKAIVFVIFILILQQIEGNLIYPKVMGSRVNLPALWILAAVTIGGGLAGSIGMLLGVPVFSTIYILLQEATENREKKLASIYNEDTSENINEN